MTQASTARAAAHRGIQAGHQHCKLNQWVAVGPTTSSVCQAGEHHRLKAAIASEVGGGEICATAGEGA